MNNFFIDILLLILLKKKLLMTCKKIYFLKFILKKIKNVKLIFLFIYIFKLL